MLLSLALAFFLSSATSSAFAIEPPKTPPTLTLITEDWPPFNYSENGELKGFATEIIKLVMKELNVNYPMELLPSSRGMTVLDGRKRVMYFSFIQTPARKPHYKWIGPFGEQAIYFYKKKDSPLQINSLADAKKVKRVCCRDRGLVFDSLKAAGFKNLDVGVNPEGIYLKTLHGRCDLSIGETSWGVAYWLKKSNYPANSLERTNVKITSSPLYIAASKDISDQEIQLWQAALDKVKTTSEYQKIYHSYREPMK